MFDIECVILSGGKSSRMGCNKSLLPFGGFNTLAQFQYERLKPLFRKTYLNVKDKSIFDFEANFIEDASLDIFSSAYGLLNSLRFLQKSIFVISVDTPFISENMIRRLFEISNSGQMCTISNCMGKLHTLCAVYTVEAIKPLEYMMTKDDHKLQHLINNIAHKVVDFPFRKPFLNINSSEDYEKAKKRFLSASKIYQLPSHFAV